MLSEQTLYLFQQGDQQAFRSIFDYFYKKIYWFAYGYVQNREQAEEIIADQFIKLWHKKENFRTYEEIGAFLKICTRNACIDQVRSRNANTKQFQQWLQHQTEQEFSIEDITVIRKDTWYDIMNMALYLPTEARKIFLLHFIEGMRLGEIAILLNKNESTVYNQKFRIVAKLRKVFQHRKPFFLE